MPHNLAKLVSKESLIKALEEIIQTKPVLRSSTGFDIVYQGQRFPPKEVVRMAAQLQGIEGWQSLRLSGGESTNRHLRAKGFDVVPKSGPTRFFIAGAVWDGSDDQTSRFVEDGIWENGYSDRFIEEVKAIPVGARFAIKSSFAKKGESILRIKALGTVTLNHGDGRKIAVDWDDDVDVFDLSGLGAYRATLHEVTNREHIQAIFYREDDNEQLMPYQKKDINFPLNTILYGPPGTGKTYHTVNKAVAIANPEFDLEGKSRRDIKAEYDRLMMLGQIQFVTFHQSLSYEDFIEGIKPGEPKESDSFLKYRVEDGIFKRMVEQAAYVPDVQEASVYLSDAEWGKATFYTLGLNTATQPGDKAIYRYCIDHNCIALDVAEGFDASGKSESEIKKEAPSDGAILTRFVHHLKKDNYVLLCDGDSTCRAIGRVTGNYHFQQYDDITPDHFRDVEWLVKDVQIPREQLYSDKFHPGLERLDKQEVVQDFFTKTSVAVLPALVRRNYVLIIDEINRGNVSQIFGELISLIEEDKRKGRAEALTVTLPYSKKPFSVPDNLFLIGTMNTADRSVEALDTALRRRFVFEEMAPKPELLSPAAILANVMNKPIWINHDFTDPTWRAFAEPLYEMLGATKNIEDELSEAENEDDGSDAEWAAEHLHNVNFDVLTGLNLKFMLEIINQRLEVLLSKDHTIGHAWFMGVYSLEDLQQVFRNKILPLFQEYFYNNFEKIGLVLGKSFLQSKEAKGIFAKDFGGFSNLKGDYEEKVSYTLTNPAELTLQNFQNIYQ